MQIKTIVAAILALTVFAAGAFTARWILGEKHARELAEVRLAGLSAQLSFAGHATEQAAIRQRTHQQRRCDFRRLSIRSNRATRIR